MSNKINLSLFTFMLNQQQTQYPINPREYVEWAERQLNIVNIPAFESINLNRTLSTNLSTTHVNININEAYLVSRTIRLLPTNQIYTFSDHRGLFLKLTINNHTCSIYYHSLNFARFQLTRDAASSDSLLFNAQSTPIQNYIVNRCIVQNTSTLNPDFIVIGECTTALENDLQVSLNNNYYGGRGDSRGTPTRNMISLIRNNGINNNTYTAWKQSPLGLHILIQPLNNCWICCGHWKNSISQVCPQNTMPTLQGLLEEFFFNQAPKILIVMGDTNLPMDITFPPTLDLEINSSVYRYNVSEIMFLSSNSTGLEQFDRIYIFALAGNIPNGIQSGPAGGQTIIPNGTQSGPAGGQTIIPNGAQSGPAGGKKRSADNITQAPSSPGQYAPQQSNSSEAPNSSEQSQPASAKRRKITYRQK